MKRKELEGSDEERPHKKIRFTEEMETYSIHSLPREVHQQIGSFMDDSSKRQMRLASVSWFKIINYTNFYICIPRNEMMDALVDRLSTYTQPISLRFTKEQCLDTENRFKVSRLTNLTSLRFQKDFRCNEEDWLRLSTLTNLEYFKSDAVFTHYSFKLLENFKKLREIETYRLNFNFGELASVLEKLLKLERIKLTAESPDEVNLISKMHAEHLTSLEMNFMNKEVLLSVADVAKFSNLKKLVWMSELDEPIVFPIYKLPNLESLECYSKGHMQHIHTVTNLTHLALWAIHSEPNTEPLSKLTNLVSLMISGDQEYQFEFLRSMPHLVDLDAQITGSGEFLTIIPHENLTRLTLLSIGHLNSAYVTRFSRLQQLEFATHRECPNMNESIRHLTSLTSAKFGFWVQVMDHVDFSPLTNLQELTLSKVSPQVTSTLHALTQLTKLEVTLSLPTELKFLENMPLKCLEMDFYDGPDLWPILAKMTTLERLKLILIDERDEEIKSLSGLTNLTCLRVIGRITGEHFTALKSLQMIDFGGAQTKPFYTREELEPYLPNLLEYNCGDLRTWRGQPFM